MTAQIGMRLTLRSFKHENREVSIDLNFYWMPENINKKQVLQMLLIIWALLNNKIIDKSGHLDSLSFFEQ